MGKAIGSSLPTAVAITVSPLAIVASVLMLASRRAAANGLAFLLGWLLGLAAVGTIVLAVAGSTGVDLPGKQAAWASWLDIALGVALLWVGGQEFRHRPRGSEQPKMPKWMAALDSVTPPGAAGAGALLGGVNPKNLLLAIAGAAAIAQTGIAAGEQAAAYAVFAVVGTAGVAAPLVIYLAAGARAQRLLSRLRDWMSHNNAVILSVLCLLIAAKLIGDAIVSLTS